MQTGTVSGMFINQYQNMKKRIFILFAGLLLAFTTMSYYFKKRDKPGIVDYECQITVTGTARNLNGQAAIITPNTAVFYVQGLQEWDPAWLDQEVRVTGDLLRIDRQANPFGGAGDKARIISAAVVLLLDQAPISEY
jgi:hypothetical protein